MLVLSRKVGERILIGENVSVTVVRISPNEVRIGVDAPADTVIVRKELLTRGDQGVAAPQDAASAKKPK